MGEPDPDRTWSLSYSLNERTVYRYDPKTGVLRLSISPSDLTVLSSVIGELTPDGKDITLPIGLPLHSGPIRFKGLKRIESILDESGKYFISTFSC